ncbi:VOC family protein [Deinococcus planocerae]|uniref:VOC family protein n=1 Tax=Deinococcus planocerae TaxID=1737569 RepID=UPI000C7E894D|nr:VOC family protein [Deinococcus planocerae]
MNLNHVNLAVTDVGATVSLLETYFGLRRTRLVTGDMAFLRDDGGALISLFREDDVIYPPMFHIGFTRETVEEVDEVYRRLVEGGFHPQAPREDHGRWTFYFMTPGGFTVEVQKFHRELL